MQFHELPNSYIIVWFTGCSTTLFYMAGQFLKFNAILYDASIENSIRRKIPQSFLVFAFVYVRLLMHGQVVVHILNKICNNILYSIIGKLKIESSLNLHQT